MYVLEVQLDEDRQPDVIRPTQIVRNGYDEPQKDEPNSEMVVGSVGFQGGVHKTVTVRYDCRKIVVPYGTLQHVLASSPCDFTSLFENGLWVCKSALWEANNICWVRGDLECHRHDDKFASCSWEGRSNGQEQRKKRTFVCDRPMFI